MGTGRFPRSDQRWEVNPMDTRMIAITALVIAVVVLIILLT
jgi:hypothetical protein